MKSLAGTPLPVRTSSGSRCLHKGARPANFNGLPGRTCSRCGKYKPLADFYRKGDRVERRCNDCILRSKARTYKKKQKVEREVVWHEVFETPYYGGESPKYLESLLRDFMMEVILDDDGK